MTGSPLPSPLKILLAEDNRLTRVGLVYSFQANTQFQIIGEAENGEEAIWLAAELQPDVIIMDIEMPLMDGIRATQCIKEQFPHIKVVMFTSYAIKDQVYVSLTAGADAYCLKDISFSQLIKVLKDVMAGEVYLDPALAQYVHDFFKDKI